MSATAQRLDSCLPIDVSKLFDSTVTQTQLDNDTFVGSTDDKDTLASYIEDAAGEFRQQTDVTMQLSRVGVPGNRETFEQTTHKISGHKLTKITFSGVWSDYLPTEKEMVLDNTRLLPFDSSTGDAVYLYKGLDESGNAWEDVTADQGDIWDILDHVGGRFVFSPARIAEEYIDTVSTARGTVPSFLKRIRFAISYRHGAQGGSRQRATSTDLDEDITDTQTGTVSVTDGSGFPTDGGASIIVLIDREYVRVVPDPSNNQMEIVERGVRGTDGASHNSGERVQYTPPAVRKAIASRAAMSVIDSGRYQSFLPGEEDSISKGDMMDDFQSTWQTTVDALS
jgi:hypothetical protein